MNYMIHNEDCIQSDFQRQELREIVRRQMGRLSGADPNYPDSIAVDLYLDKPDRETFQVSAIVNLKDEIIYLKEEGRNMDYILRSLFNNLMLRMTRTINRERREYRWGRKDRQYRTFIDNLSELRNLKQEKAGEMFQRLIRLISGDVATYIRRRLKLAEMTTAINRGVFKIQELLDDLFLMAYDRFDEVPENEGGIRSWLYHMADELLQQKFREMEFEKRHFQNLAALVEAEYKSLEELQDSSGPDDWYSADNLLIGEDEDTLLDEITLKMNQKEIHLLMEKELAKLPVLSRTIMDLYLINQMNVEEIAGIKKISSEEVEKVVREVSRNLTNKLFFLTS